MPGKSNGNYPQCPQKMQTLHMLWLARGISSDQHPTQHRAQTRTPTQDNRFSPLLVLILIPVWQDFIISPHAAAVLTGSFQVPQALTATVKPICLHQKHPVSILVFDSLFPCLQGSTNGSLHCSLELQIPWSIYAVKVSVNYKLRMLLQTYSQVFVLQHVHEMFSFIKNRWR